MRLSIMDQQSPPVRFRAIIEMSFPDADRLDPDYDRLIDAWRKALEENPAFNCKDVSIREIMTIGSSESEDDYERWRREDLSHVSPGIRVTDGVAEFVAEARRYCALIENKPDPIYGSISTFGATSRKAFRPLTVASRTA